MIDKETAEQIVDVIVHDLSGRPELWKAWEVLDAEIQAEIRAEWVSLVLAHN